MNDDDKTRIDLYLKFYDQVRREVYMRHDFLFKIYALSMIGIFSLLKFSVESPALYFLVPVFASFNFVIYLYNFGSKSLYASYGRVLEIRLKREYPLVDVPMLETFGGTFGAERNRSRNFAGIWALRSLLLPVLLVITVAAYFIAGEITPINLILVVTFLVLDILAVLSYVRMEHRNSRTVSTVLSESAQPTQTHPTEDT